MPRHARVIPDGSVQHTLNRGNRRATIFQEPSDYEYFMGLVADANERFDMRLLAFGLMPNHWHLVFWVRAGIALSAYMQWLLSSHVRHHQSVRGLTGTGHVYQGRFKNFTVEDSIYMYRVLRYAEGNAARAGLVRLPEEWEWCSLHPRYSGTPLLSDWPLPRPENWVSYVNQGIHECELSSLRHSTRRGTPYGSEQWVDATVAQYDLQSTIRKPGRQARRAKPETVTA